MATFFANNYPLLGPNDTAAIVARYPQLPALPAHAAFFPSTSRAYGEATFICPAVNVLDAMGRHWDSARLWYYRYNVYDEDNFAWGMGVPHLFEAAAVFGADNILGAPASYYSYNAPIIPVVMNYWISFVRALDPNTFRYASAPVWGSWGPNGSRMVFETGNLTMEDTQGTRQRGVISGCHWPVLRSRRSDLAEVMTLRQNKDGRPVFTDTREHWLGVVAS